MCISVIVFWPLSHVQHFANPMDYSPPGPRRKQAEELVSMHRQQGAAGTGAPPALPGSETEWPGLGSWLGLGNMNQDPAN